MSTIRHHLYVLLLLALPGVLFSQTEQVIVTVAKADIYAEPNTYSYKIDTVNRGTLLSLFQKTKVNDSWYYVRFQSRRYGGPAMGFIRDTDVEPYAGEAAQPPQPKAETKPPPEPTKKVVSEKKPPETERKAEEQKPPPEKKQVIPPPEEKPVPEKKVEVKPPVVTTEETSVATTMPGGLRLGMALDQARDGLSGRLWLRTTQGAASTAAPSSRSVRAPSPRKSLEGRVYETVQSPQPKPAPPPKKETRRPAAKTPEETPFVARKRPAQPPTETGPILTTTAFSENVSLSKGAESFEVNLDFAPFASFRSFEIPDPVRMVVDFQDVGESAGFHRYAVNDLGIAAIRVAMYQDNIARVVFDFRQEIPAYQIEQTEGGIKILFWLARAAQPPVAEPEAEPTPPPEEKAVPEPEPAIATEVVLHETATPFSSRFTLAEPISPPRPRLFLWLERGTVETAVPRRTIANLPSYYPPMEEAYWEKTRTEPVRAQPAQKTDPLVIPPPQAELETARRKEAAKPVPKAKVVEEKKTPPAEPPPVEAKRKEAETKAEEQVTPPPEQIRPPTQAPYTQPQVKLPARLSLGLGYGSSTGGFGGFVQYNLSPGLALHGGVGYYPTSLIYSETDWVENQVLYSFGLKLYIPLVSQTVRGYLNLQYGGFAVEAVQIIEGIWDYEFIYRNEQQTLFGPQALLGGEFRLGPLRLNAAAGAAYALTEWEYLPQDFYFTFDLGFLFSLK